MTPRRTHFRVVTTCCHPGCGAQIEAAANHRSSALCETHRRQHYIESHARAQAKRRTNNPPTGRPEQFATILYDPDTECGFSVGAQISSRDVEYMLKLGTFTAGTVLRRRTLTYSVRGTGPQRLVKVDYVEKG